MTRGTDRRVKGTQRKGERRSVRMPTSTIDLFHRLWGQAKDGVYVKADWMKMQKQLEENK